MPLGVVRILCPSCPRLRLPATWFPKRHRFAPNGGQSGVASPRTVLGSWYTAVGWKQDGEDACVVVCGPRTALSEALRRTATA